MYRWCTNYFIFDKKKTIVIFCKIYAKKIYYRNLAFLLEFSTFTTMDTKKKKKKKKYVLKFVNIIIYLSIYIFLYFQSPIIYLKLIPKSINNQEQHKRAPI